MKTVILIKMQTKEVVKAKQTYQEIFREFLEQGSIHGLKIFRLHVSAKIAKKLWFGLIVIVIFWTHYIITNLTIDFIQQPTELHMSTNLVHVVNSPFPGIAICSANKISRRKLSNLTEQVFRAQQAYRPGLLTRNMQDMSEQLLNLAGFYLYPFHDFQANEKDLERLHGILSFMFNTTSYPIRDILHSLAPDCQDLVIRGSVLGERINVTDYFVKRTTSSSICCMFNYRRESYAWDRERRSIENNVIRRAKKISFESNSVLNSVQFVTQMDVNDVAYKDLTNDAFQLIIFSNEDYAAVQSNTVGELLVDHNTIIEIPIEPRFFASSSQIRSFSPKIRKCYFPEEGQKILNLSFYSMDECLLICRMNSMIRYCGCVSPPMIATTSNVTYCNLIDLPCLHKWKNVWFGWNYFDYVNTDDDDQKSSYEGCDHCLPTCDGVEFDFDWNTLPLRRALGPTYTKGLLAGLSNSKPLAVIKLFFESRQAQETIEDVVADWILLLNRFGGILSLMYGFSIITYIEIVYYLTGKWFFHTWSSNTKKVANVSETSIRRSPKHKLTISKELVNDIPAYHEIYWNELKPKYANRFSNLLPNQEWFHDN